MRSDKNAPFFVETKLRVLTSSGLGLALFVISALVGVLVAYDPSLSWPVWLTLLGSVILFLVIANASISPWWIASSLVLIASVLGLYFGLQVAYFGYQDKVGSLANLGRASSSLIPALVYFTPHPNAVAGFLEGVVLVSLALAWQARGFKRFIWSLTTIIMVCALAISGSRGAWLGLAVVFGIFLLIRVPKRVRRFVGAGLGLMAGLLLGSYLMAHFALNGAHKLFPDSLTETVDSRFALYENSLNLLKDYPVSGIGSGATFAMIYARYQLLIHVPYLYYAHNLFLSVGLGQGLLGLVALAWLLIEFYRFVVRVERGGPNGQSLLLFRAAWLGTTTTLIHGLVDSVQFSADYWTMPMLLALAGLTVAAGRPALAQTESHQLIASSGRKRHFGQWTGLAAIVVVLAMVTIIFWQVIASAWYTNIGAVYQTQAELSPNLKGASRELILTRAAINFERALRLNPTQAVANRRLGMMALDRHDYEAAIVYLEQAYATEPHNQATLKALGYAYLWTGQQGPALELFRQVKLRTILVQELTYWHWWWGEQDQAKLSGYAQDMAQRLSTE